MKVAEAMIPNPLTVQPDTTLLEFIERVLNSNQTTAMVIEAGRLVGMVSVKDVFRRILPPYVAPQSSLAAVLRPSYFEDQFEIFKTLPVGSVMTTEVDSLAPDDTVIHAVALFVHKDLKTIPVLQDGNYLGSVTRRSVLWMVTRKAT